MTSKLPKLLRTLETSTEAIGVHPVTVSAVLRRVTLRPRTLNSSRRRTLEGREIPVKAGSAVFILAMAEHGIRQTGSEILCLFYAFPVDSLDSVEYLFSAAPPLTAVPRNRLASRSARSRIETCQPEPVAIAVRVINLAKRRAPMSSTAMLLTSYSAAPGRECGACTLCCKVYALPEFAKPPGVWCKHCAPGKGCAIHEAPPDQCRQFFCLWMTDGTMPAEWKPDRARFVLSIYPTNGFVYGQVDPGAPGAWRRAPYFDGLRAMAKTLLEQKRHVIMFVGDQATLVMPDETLSLGAMTANDNFRIEPAFGPNGPTWRATKL